MKKRKETYLAWILAVALILTGISLPGQTKFVKADSDFGTTRTYSDSVTATVANKKAPSADWSEFEVSLTNNTGENICDWIVVLQVPSGKAGSFKCWNATFAADGDTIYLYPKREGTNAVVAPGHLDVDVPGGGFTSNYVDASQITVKAVYYNKGTKSEYDYSDGTTNDDAGSGSSSGGGSSSATDTSTNKDLTVEYNYAKLLQESLYFYDANMCGTQVEEHCGLNWRGNCHTQDQSVTYQGTTVDVSGGFHDAGDHVKFGLPQGYAASVLGMSYYEFGTSYDELKLTAHLQTITDYFCNYFKRCTVYQNYAERTGDVIAFCYQVGDGNADHGYWGAPEKQTGSRPAYFADSSNPATDEVSVAIAALALNYMNFKNQEDLQTAKDLFAFAQKNSKSCATQGASPFYSSDSWQDDYALAASALYAATGEAAYQTEYNNNKSGINTGWVLDWSNTGCMAAMLADDSSIVAQITNTKSNGSVLDGTFQCIKDWGSCRYNAALQFTGLVYDKMSNTSEYASWAKSQMDYILGNNPNKRCYVVGYHENSSKYPHHRAASCSSDASQISANHYTLLGALVGGPKMNGYYQDDQADYCCNEVALDYNAGLVGAAAGLYYHYKNSTEENYSTTLASQEELSAVGVTKFYEALEGQTGGEEQQTAAPATNTETPSNTGMPAGSATEAPGNSGVTSTNAPVNPEGTKAPNTSGATASPLPQTTLQPSATIVPGNASAGVNGSRNTVNGQTKKTKVTLKKKVLKVKKGKKVRIRIKKKAATDSVKAYKIVGKKKVVKVSRKGVVTGRKKGKTTVKVIMRSGASAKCKIIVKK